jgi:hypothetical protein
MAAAWLSTVGRADFALWGNGCGGVRRSPALPSDMLKMKAYLDDSGTDANSPVVIVGGLLGLAEDWDKLNAAWRAKLDSPYPGKPPIPFFSLGKCFHRKRPFEDYDRPERDALRADFRKLIASSDLRNLSFAIPVAIWDELVVPPCRSYLGSALEACFHGFIEHAVDIVRPVTNSDRIRIEFVFDKGGAKGRRVRELASWFEKDKGRYAQVELIRFERVADHPGLQAADTIATESYWNVQSYLRDGDLSGATAQFQQLCTEMAGEGFYLDREGIKALIDQHGPDGRLLR